MAIADLATLVAAAAGAKNVDPKDFNRFELARYRLEAKQDVPPAAAKTFIRLMDSEQVPSWVLSIADVELIKAAAS